MEWSDLRVFLAVARKGSLGGAARSLKQSQPTMGRRLNALEASLGRTLFQRTPQGFVLTEEGARLLGRVERMEEEALGIAREVAAPPSEWEGTLKIGSSEWFGALVLPPLLAEFARSHPGVTIELLTDHRLPSLSRRDLDVGFRIVPFEEPDVVARRLFQMPYGVYSAGPPVLLTGEGVRIITLTAGFDHLPDGAWLRRKLPGAKVAFRSHNREVQAQMCALGVGVAVLPRPLGDSVPGITRRDLGEEPPSRDTWIGYHRDQGRSPLVRAFVDLAVRTLRRPEPL